eukprot:tig00000863_g5001.t1
MCFEAFASSAIGASAAAKLPEGVDVTRGKGVDIYFAAASPAAAWVEKTQSLWSYAALEVGGDAQTILAALFRRAPEGLHYAREEMEAEDGGLFALDYGVASAGAPPDSIADPATPVLLLLPGLTGGSGDRYIRFCALHALRSGFRPVVYCPRGSSGLALRTAQFYSASFTGDLRQAVGHLRRRYPAAPLFAAGWSLGSNVLVRYLGEEGEGAPLAGAASLANPWCLETCDANFREGAVQRLLYDPKLASGMRAMFQPHASLFESCPRRSYDVRGALKARTVREWDEAITVRSFGWRDTAHYYAASSSKLALPHVAVPLLCINAQDDPIAVGHAVPYHTLPGNEKVVMAVTRRGGHNGWQTAADPFGAPWTDVPLIEFFHTLLNFPRTAAGSASPADPPAGPAPAPPSTASPS